MCCNLSLSVVHFDMVDMILIVHVSACESLSVLLASVFKPGKKLCHTTAEHYMVLKTLEARNDAVTES